MWFNMAKWANKMPCCLPTDPVLASELPAPRFDYRVVNKRTVFVLESKESMKDRGVPSPNRADATALTFAGPVNPLSKEERHRRGSDVFCEVEYDPFKQESTHG
jgi:hypothetical protein